MATANQVFDLYLMDWWTQGMVGRERAAAPLRHHDGRLRGLVT